MSTDPAHGSSPIGAHGHDGPTRANPASGAWGEDPTWHHDAPRPGDDDGRRGTNVPYVDDGVRGPANPQWPRSDQPYPYSMGENPSPDAATQGVGTSMHDAASMYGRGATQNGGAAQTGPVPQGWGAQGWGAQGREAFGQGSQHGGGQAPNGAWQQGMGGQQFVPQQGSGPWQQGPAQGFVPGHMPYAPGASIDPMTGEPLSDKSKVVAGLLQFFLGVFGAGRFYIGDNRIGGIQLALGLIGFFGTFILVGFPILVGVSIWALIDAVLMLTGSVRDPYGRKLS